ncbi:gamma carbonic anhydrase family protein [Sphingosinicella sp. LY1275]|uniref:gamma carbonic anhydrase family protein n=1 Tax=Sphingosinicella sp. LY1275 TaxID=3095379 RepID=UPI002ADEACBA|nr:gamma carbonic anhydrase family protein [Sphingosinicella sp. LY1275]MEA1013040.1 gamma carbonic anhydrase family protein [Sphingosinicella sp. LY1275]
MTLLTFGGKSPQVDPAAFVAPGAQLIGDVAIGPESSIWYNCVLRGDVNRIRIGARTNIQDGSVVHVDSPKPGAAEGHPTLIGDDVLIGHMAMVHGCILHDRAFVGLGAIVMDGCEIEGGAMLAAGAMLTPGKRIPAGQLWAGRPAKYVRDLSDEELAGHRAGVAHYVALARAHAAALKA